MERIAVVGAGLIGRAWAMVFARAGCSVALWDKLPGVAEAAMEPIRARLAAGDVVWGRSRDHQQSATIADLFAEAHGDRVQ